VLGPILTAIALSYSSYSVDDDAFPNPCLADMEGSVLIAPAVTLVWDMFMNILSLCLFIIPLRKTLKEMGHTINLNDDTKMSKMSGKMFYLAVKYTLLTSGAAATTIVSLLLLLLVPPVAYLMGFDVVFNSVCLMLMTAYYPDDKYYQRLCSCCLYLCCPKKLKTYKSRASKGAEHRAKDDPSTKDTTQVYHHAMAKRESIQTQATATATDLEAEAELQITQTISLPPIVDDQNADITPEPDSKSKSHSEEP
jgi:hypothetical protein